MNIQGLSLTIVASLLLFSIIGIAILNLKYRFWFLSSDHLKNIRRRILLTICIICFIWFCSFRFGPTLLKFVNDSSYFWKITSEPRNADLSVIFFLDLCGLFAWVMPVVLLLNARFKLIKKVCAVFAVLGGLVSIYGHVIDGGLWNISYILFDIKDYVNYDEPLFFIMHFWMVGLGFYYLTICNKFSKKDVLACFGFIFIYIAYILIIQSAFDIRSHVTGLTPGDYFSVAGAPGYLGDNTIPPYHIVPELLNVSLQNWWICPTVMYLVFTIAVLLMIKIKNISFDFFKTRFANSNYCQNWTI